MDHSDQVVPELHEKDNYLFLRKFQFNTVTKCIVKLVERKNEYLQEVLAAQPVQSVHARPVENAMSLLLNMSNSHTCLLVI